MRRMIPLLLLAATPALANTGDANSAPYQGEVAMTPGALYAPTRAVKANCTAAGNVSVLYVDGGSGVWAVVVGTQVLPVAAQAVNTAGTTATCGYAGLK